ncbi:type 1 glutamine amidotransferase [Segnochrobactrum spirostomi]|uniref:Type 1 glutamine amidotransferase n=1 Tax=Segnochrobactrum spirostomi TaxID=2608987 RepID=A0A6A7XY98_9HYPH|nr:type 1 glutamine amidotransferase [Segnochrobactrum spirostomi]MQT11363.1 type 1 glutamine amidotransferase [Segnochrobactrum spirostomi]
MSAPGKAETGSGRAPRLLVVEGNTAEVRRAHAAIAGGTPSDSYAAVLQKLAPDAVVDICYPADPGANIPDKAGLAGYDGVAIGGSALNIYKAEPEALRQIEFARTIFEEGVPFFGSCWGLQVATVAAGGSVRRNPNGREIGPARKICATPEDAAIGLHAGKGAVFDAPAIHIDEVDVRPAGMVVTAGNGISAVQGAAISHGNGTFWGVQYHPEMSLADLAAYIIRYSERLIGEGLFANEADALGVAADYRTLAADPTRKDLAWRYGFDADLLDETIRLAELANWIEKQVRPGMSRRGRG